MAALQKGDLVLVTGATGLIGAWVADQSLAAGLKVRVVSRTEKKAKVLSAALKKKYPEGHVEVAIVSDMQVDGAWDEAVKGVQGVAHVASVLTFADSWKDVVEPSVRGAVSLVEAASKQPSIRRFALTSSSVSLGFCSLTKPQHWTTDTWHDIVDEAKKSPNRINIYAASKVLAEKGAWEAVEKLKPGFKLTSINPNLNIGPNHPGASTASSNRFIQAIAAGSTEPVDSLSSQWFINVVDVARLHVLALTRADVGNERILSFEEVFTWKQIVDEIVQIDPQSKAKDIDTSSARFTDKDLTTVDSRRMLELLEKTQANLALSIRQLLGKADVHPAPKWY